MDEMDLVVQVGVDGLIELQHLNPVQYSTLS